MSGSSTCRSGRPATARWLACSLLAGAVALATGVAARSTRSARCRSTSAIDWGSESGFPGGPVYAIAQTSDGYLWIGAEKGLVRFDGLTFRLFDAGADAHAGPGGARRRRRRRTAACGRGCAASALVRYRDGASTTCSPDQGSPESVVTAMDPGPGRRMLLATLAHGAVAYRGGRFDVRSRLRAMPSSSFVISIAEAANGDSGSARRDAGLLRVRGAARHADTRRVCRT